MMCSTDAKKRKPHLVLYCPSLSHLWTGLVNREYLDLLVLFNCFLCLALNVSWEHEVEPIKGVHGATTAGEAALQVPWGDFPHLILNFLLGLLFECFHL